MRENLREMSYIQVLISLVFFSAAISAGYAYYLTASGKHLHFQQALLESPLYYVPPSLAARFVEDSFSSTALGAGLVAAHVGLAAILGACLVLLGGRIYLWRQDHAQGDALQIRRPVMPLSAKATYLRMSGPGYDTVLVAPNGHVFKHAAPDIQLRLDRTPLSYKRPPQTPLQKLEAALLETLYCHRNWTCDPSGHHSDVGLYEHSRNVANELAKVSSDPLARVVGLAHDIGKILTYKRKKTNKGGQWVKVAEHHDKLSAHIVRMLPEYQALEDRDKNTLHTVLYYAHNPDEVPARQTTERELKLLQQLRRVDGLATRSDQASIPNLVDHADFINAIAEGLRLAIPRLNVNAYRGGKTDGWTRSVQDYIAVREAALREKLADVLSPDHAAQLGLSISPTSKGHPATPVIVQALRQMGYLRDEYDGQRAPDALFSIKPGVHTFHYVLLVNRDAIEQEMPNTAEDWGDCPWKIHWIRPYAGGGKEAGADAEPTGAPA